MLPSLDLSSLLPFVLTAVALVFGALCVVKRAASKYFVVDAGFEAREGYDSRRRMSIGGAAGGDPGACASCGRAASKWCSRCKTVRYCSQACQTKHWRAEHKQKCKSVKPDTSHSGPSGDDGAYGRRKTSGLGAISLVPARGPCKVLEEPKKILFPYDEFIKLFNWDEPGFPPCGLLNCGNSCFANVVLQCLSCTRPLTAYLVEKDHSRTCVRKQEDWCFLCELQAHILRACQSRQPFSPINILSRIPNIGGNLGYGSQEDAHEFMRFAIDMMQSVCLDEHGGEKALDPSTQETTLIQHIFGGHLQSQVKCTKCNKISNRYENMMDLTVEIHGDAESLEECLDQFTAKEWLDGDNMYKCDGCNDYVKAWKRLTVHQAPNILTIALKRFQSGRFGKLNKRVSFPEELDLSRYMSNSGDGTDLYSLYAVVVHVDMLNASFFGHYICYTKDYYGRWYRIDDCKVTVVDVEEVLSQGAYMLLYSRRTARKEPFVKPIEPARQEHLAAKGVDVVDVPNGEVSADSLSALPTCSSSNHDLADISSSSGSQLNVSLLRDTGHDRDVETDSHRGQKNWNLEVRGKGLEDVDMNDFEISLTEPNGCQLESSTHPSCVQADTIAVSDIGTDFLLNVVPSSSGAVHEVECDAPEDCGNVNSRQRSSVDVCNMDCEQSFGSSDTNIGITKNYSVTVEGEGLENVYMNDSEISSMEPNGCQLESSIQLSNVQDDTVVSNIRIASLSHIAHSSSGEVQDVECEELEGCVDENSRQHSSVDPCSMWSEQSLGTSDTNVDIKENGPVFVSGGMSCSSECTLDGSWNKNVPSNIISNKVGLSPDANRSSVSYTEISASSEPNQDSMMVEPYSGPTNGLGRVGVTKYNNGKTCSSQPPVSENGSMGKPRPLFSRGFLDKPTRKKSLSHRKAAKSEKPKASPFTTGNGYQNGHAELGIDANAVNFRLPSARSHSTDSDMAYLDRGFLNSNGKQECELANGHTYFPDTAARVVDNKSIAECDQKRTNGSISEDDHMMLGNGFSTSRVEGECGNCE